jgi:hypothetical protein
MKESSCHNPKMEAYCKAIQCLEDRFDGLELNHIMRKYNEATDKLAKITSGQITVPPDVFASDLYKPSVDYRKPGQEGDQPPEPTLGSDSPEGSDPPSTPEPEVINVDEERLDRNDKPDWHIPYLACLVQGVLPLDQMQARRLARWAKSFVLLDRELYKRSASGILQRCIPTKEGRQLLHEIHSGACGHHATPRTLVGTPSGKVSTGQLLWPTPPRSYALVRGDNSMRGRRISQHKLCR